MLTHALELNAILIDSRTARRPRRVSPWTNEITSQIIAPAPASAAPLIAADIPVAIDPGPVLGVGRDDLTDAAVVETPRPPAEVDDPAETDPAVSTPDLVRALHRTPRHVVLVFSGHRVALLEGSGGHLAPAARSGFPMDLPALDSSADHVDSRQSALAAVDRALGSYLRTRPAPVVLAGRQTLLTAFWSTSRNLARLAGTVYGGFDDVPTTELTRRIRPVLDRYLEAHRYAALALLQDRSNDEQTASGITSVWHASRTQEPEMLLVEGGYRFRARLSPDGDAITPVHDDVASSEVIDNVVDELIETVLTRGGSIVLAHDGALAGHGRIALTLR